MKILHTADLHLRSDEDDRWKALCRLIEIGKEEEVEIFVISGDLFDKGVDAEALRPKIREIFSNNGFKIVLIPGNHDSESYQSGMYFGTDTVVLRKLQNPFENEDLVIWGLPFEDVGREEILHRLRWLTNNLNDDKWNILLYHGELLDAFFSRKDFGEEGKARYMPVKLSYFKSLNLDYVLAGHFHTNFDTRKFRDGGYFVYPGSPISITKNETGRRKVNIFEVGNPPEERILETPHYENVDIKLDPFSDKDPIERIRKRLDVIHPEGKVFLKVEGYINSENIGRNETELIKQIDEITDNRVEEARFEFKDMQRILEDDLFKNFISKLEQKDYDEEEKKRLREVAIQAMSRGGL